MAFSEAREIQVENGDLLLYPDFFGAAEADLMLQRLLREIVWQQPRIRIMGKSRLIPRLQAWYGDTAAAYRYSGLMLQPLPWTETLLQVKNRVELAVGTKFNSVLVNRYRDGRDSVGWHSDDEPELGVKPIIASLSFGATRTFRLQHKKYKEQRLGLVLTHGSMLLMRGELQHHWRHQLPKSKSVTQERINLTFRRILSV